MFEISEISLPTAFAAGALRPRPPKLGEHTDQILLELGYDKGEIASLRKARVI